MGTVRVLKERYPASPNLKAEMDKHRMLEIAGLADTGESYCISLKEAARRDEKGIVALHLQDLRRTLCEALRLWREIEPKEGS